MSLLNKILILVFATELLLVSIQHSYALYSDSAQSTGNIFTAALEFTGPSGIADHPVISEVQLTEGPGNTTHDFIELYNPKNTNYDLNGHRIVKRSGNSPNDNTIKSWTNTTIIPAYGFYLWASNNDSTFPASIGADTSTSDTLAADNSIALRLGAENSGSIIDILSWNEGSTLVEGAVFSPNPDANQSMERKAYSTSTDTSMMTGSDINKGNGYDTNNNSTDFILRTTSQPQNSLSTTEIP